MTDPLAGEVQIPGFPFKSSDPFPDDNYTAAALGEHNFEVLNGLLGKSPAIISELTEKGFSSQRSIEMESGPRHSDPLRT
ncbi:MAG: hypothetical protein CM15mP49_05910 [Actinomycetota bacterium]|nr:MAG: hypothetical protein CM15mP49_05910 [Actinomycetota bacterium]